MTCKKERRRTCAELQITSMSKKIVFKNVANKKTKNEENNSISYDSSESSSDNSMRIMLRD